MPRLNSVDPKTDSGPGADLLNGPLKDKQINIFKHLAINPPVLKAFLSFSQGVKNALSERQHELIALVCAAKRNCDYCAAAHTAIGKSAGISDDQALDIRRGKAADRKEQALIDFTTAMLDEQGFVNDKQLDAFREAGFNDEAVVEVIAAIAVNTFTNYFNHVNETEVDFPVPASVAG